MRAASRRSPNAGAISPRSAPSRSPSPTISISAIPSGRRSWASWSWPSRASARPAARSTSPSSPAMCRSTTRPTARRSCHPGDRRRRPSRPTLANGDHRLQGRRRCHPAHRRPWHPSRPDRSICAKFWAARKAPRRRSIWPRRSAMAISFAASSRSGAVTACHDISDGGLLTRDRRDGAGRPARGDLQPVPRALHVALFAEDQARYVVTCLPQPRPAFAPEALAKSVPAGAASARSPAAH